MHDDILMPWSKYSPPARTESERTEGAGPRTDMEVSGVAYEVKGKDEAVPLRSPEDEERGNLVA